VEDVWQFVWRNTQEGRWTWRIDCVASSDSESNSDGFFFSGRGRLKKHLYADYETYRRSLCKSSDGRDNGRQQLNKDLFDRLPFALE